jgi:hypothetical protein
MLTQFLNVSFFGGNNKVLMKNGFIKLVKDISIGDTIKTSLGDTNVKMKLTIFNYDYFSMLKLDNNVISLNCPVLMNGMWRYPNEINKCIYVSEKHIYSFVLDQHHIININNFEHMTIGNNTDVKKLYHPYFSSQNVINDLIELNKISHINNSFLLSHDMFIYNDKHTDIEQINKNKFIMYNS